MFSFTYVYSVSFFFYWPKKKSTKTNCLCEFPMSFVMSSVAPFPIFIPYTHFYSSISVLYTHFMHIYYWPITENSVFFHLLVSLLFRFFFFLFLFCFRVFYIFCLVFLCWFLFRIELTGWNFDKRDGFVVLPVAFTYRLVYNINNNKQNQKLSFYVFLFICVLLHHHSFAKTTIGGTRRRFAVWCYDHTRAK